MAITRTTSDYRSWLIQSKAGTPEEFIEYISGITSWDDDEVKVINVSAPDEVVNINGIPSFVQDSEDREPFSTIYQPVEFNSEGHRVSNIAYYADRDTVEVQYSCHPLDPLPRNTRHSGEDFAEFFAKCFTWWKTGALERTQQEIIIEPTFD